MFEILGEKSNQVAESSKKLINKDTDIKIFIDDNKSKGQFFKPRSFISYEQS